MQIRRLHPDERAAVSIPMQTYCFEESPPTEASVARLTGRLPYAADTITLAAEEDGVPVAEASGIALRQNVRGRVYPMAGIAGVLSMPPARRRGYARALVLELLGQLREAGHPVSALYPFRPSFYERLGYATLPKPKTVRLAPADLRPLLDRDLPGTVDWGPPARLYESHLALTERLLAQRHGFAVLPVRQTDRLRDATDRWLVTATVAGQVAAALPYRLVSHGGELTGDDLIAADPIGRALILRFLAEHTDQVAAIQLTVPPQEYPELWVADAALVAETRTTVAVSMPPMARVLSVPGLAGLPVGPAAVTVEVAADPFIAGVYDLDGHSGELTVSPAAGSPEATLTAAGLSALVYGALTPLDLVARGLGTVPAAAVTALGTLFPPLVPYLHARF